MPVAKGLEELREIDDYRESPKIIAVKKTIW